MGVDWCRMKLATDDVAEVRRLIDEQATGYWQYNHTQWHITNSYYVDFDEAYNFKSNVPYLTHVLLNEDEAIEASHRALVASNKLEELLQVPALKENGEQVKSSNVEIITPAIIDADWVYPAEWRVVSERSYLPDELPTYVNQWRNHVEAFKQGAFEQYYFEWYLYVYGHHLVSSWQRLRSWAKDVEGRSNAWAQRAKDANLHVEAMQFERPETYESPLWNAKKYSGAMSFDYRKDKRYLSVIDHMEHFQALGGKILDARAKGAGDRIYTFEDFLEGLRNEDRSEGFAFLQSCVDEGYGLYLWY